MVEGIIAALILAVMGWAIRSFYMSAAGWFARGQREQAKRAEAELEAMKTRRAVEKETEKLDDETLVDQLHRGPDK